MIKIGDISDFPKSNSGKIKIADLLKNENYWVLLTAKNEKLPSKTVRCDVTARSSSRKYFRQSIKSNQSRSMSRSCSQLDQMHPAARNQ